LIKQRSQSSPALDGQSIWETAREFAAETIAALDHAKCERHDIIFIPAIRTSELSALWQLVKPSSRLRNLQFHVVLRRDAAEMNMPEKGAPSISTFFQALTNARAEGTFKFYCDTQQLCSDYFRLAKGIEFRLLPIPFPNTHPDPVSLEKWSVNPAIKLVYLGGARVEKGFNLIPAAHKALCEEFGATILWRLQAPPNSTTEEPEVIAARKQLFAISDGSVETIEHNLSTAEFRSLLISSDIVLLPYLPEFYRARSSGILVQALAAGKPVVVPANTWLSEQANNEGVVVFNNNADFPRAIARAIRKLPVLAVEAQTRSSVYATFHSADVLIQTLLTAANS
jgi:glycosyltransferase involved in cell wall biosynthesis